MQQHDKFKKAIKAAFCSKDFALIAVALRGDGLANIFKRLCDFGGQTMNPSTGMC